MHKDLEVTGQKQFLNLVKEGSITVVSRSIQESSSIIYTGILQVWLNS